MSWRDEPFPRSRTVIPLHGRSHRRRAARAGTHERWVNMPPWTPIPSAQRHSRNRQGSWGSHNWYRPQWQLQPHLNTYRRPHTYQNDREPPPPGNFRNNFLSCPENRNRNAWARPDDAPHRVVSHAHQGEQGQSNRRESNPQAPPHLADRVNREGCRGNDFDYVGNYPRHMRFDQDATHSLPRLDESLPSSGHPGPSARMECGPHRVGWSRRYELGRSSDHTTALTARSGWRQHASNIQKPANANEYQPGRSAGVPLRRIAASLSPKSARRRLPRTRVGRTDHRASGDIGPDRVSSESFFAQPGVTPAESFNKCDPKIRDRSVCGPPHSRRGLRDMRQNADNQATISKNAAAVPNAPTVSLNQIVPNNTSDRVIPHDVDERTHLLPSKRNASEMLSSNAPRDYHGLLLSEMMEPEEDGPKGTIPDKRGRVLKRKQTLGLYKLRNIAQEEALEGAAIAGVTVHSHDSFLENIPEVSARPPSKGTEQLVDTGLRGRSAETRYGKSQQARKCGSRTNTMPNVTPYRIAGEHEDAKRSTYSKTRTQPPEQTENYVRNVLDGADASVMEEPSKPPHIRDTSSSKRFELEGDLRGDRGASIHPGYRCLTSRHFPLPKRVGTAASSDECIQSQREADPNYAENIHVAASDTAIQSRKGHKHSAKVRSLSSSIKATEAEQSNSLGSSHHTNCTKDSFRVPLARGNEKPKLALASYEHGDTEKGASRTKGNKFSYPMPSMPESCVEADHRSAVVLMKQGQASDSLMPKRDVQTASQKERPYSSSPHISDSGNLQLGIPGGFPDRSVPPSTSIPNAKCDPSIAPNKRLQSCLSSYPFFGVPSRNRQAHGESSSGQACNQSNTRVSGGTVHTSFPKTIQVGALPPFTPSATIMAVNANPDDTGDKNANRKGLPRQVLPTSRREAYDLPADDCKTGSLVCTLDPQGLGSMYGSTAKPCDGAKRENHSLECTYSFGTEPVGPGTGKKGEALHTSRPNLLSKEDQNEKPKLVAICSAFPVRSYSHLDKDEICAVGSGISDRISSGSLLPLTNAQLIPRIQDTVVPSSEQTGFIHKIHDCGDENPPTQDRSSKAKHSCHAKKENPSNAVEIAYDRNVQVLQERPDNKFRRAIESFVINRRTQCDQNEEGLQANLQLVLTRNQVLAAEASNSLQKICSEPTKGLQKSVNRADMFQPVVGADVKKKVAEVLRNRSNATIEKKRRLRKIYDELRAQWNRRLELSRDNRSKKEVEAMKDIDRYLVVATKGTSALFDRRTRSGRVSTKTTPRLKTSAEINTADIDSVLSTIAAEGGTPGARHIWSKNLARIPDQNVEYGRQDASSVLIEDPIRSCHNSRAIGPWSFTEKLIFLAKFAIYQKDFRKIATFLDLKSSNQCTQFYYSNKLDLELKQFSEQVSTLKRKGLLKKRIVSIARKRLCIETKEEIEAAVNSFLQPAGHLNHGKSRRRT